jgi:hypothetical protein
MEKFSAFRVRWFPPYIYPPNIFIRTPAQGYRSVTAYLIMLIFLDFRRQPFLAPVPPLGAESVLTKILLPLRYILAIIRTSLVLLLALVYVASVRGVCLVLVKSYTDYFFHHLMHILSYQYLHCIAPLNTC